MSNDEIEFDMELNDPLGNVRKRKVQSHERISLPEGFLQRIGSDSGEYVFIVCGEDEIRIVNSKRKAKSVKGEVMELGKEE